MRALALCPFRQFYAQFSKFLKKYNSRNSGGKAHQGCLACIQLANLIGSCTVGFLWFQLSTLWVVRVHCTELRHRLRLLRSRSVF